MDQRSHSGRVALVEGGVCVLPRVTPTCSDAYSLGVAADLSLEGKTAMSQGWGLLGSAQNGQAGGEPTGTAPGLKGPGFSLSTWDTGSWRCWELRHPVPWLLQHGTDSGPATATRKHEQTLLASARR